MPELAAEVTLRLEALVASGLADTVAAQGLGATIRPPRGVEANEAGWAAIGQTLPLVAVATPDTAQSATQVAAQVAELNIGQVLGEGGMGIVRLAVQNPLARDVAVKTVRPALSAARELLVKEAITTGGLEHPNIVPIHTLGRDAEGAPLLVMKRITGVAWLSMIREPEHPAWANVTGDRLEFHLDTLMQVSNAVHFAHSKRVLHRDLKPENVMIGSYGEVYVLDWGIAIPLDGPRPTGNDVVGTPVYMAPEMARGDLAKLDERTDVYLLGAILHEALTGAPPHLGPLGTLFEVLQSAVTSSPKDYDDDVPRLLAAIARRAMQRDPSQRYQSADEFRRALAEFLRQRSSIRVSDEAQQRLSALLALLREAEAVDPILAYKLFGECRFGFQHAIGTFADNAEAKLGLSQAVEAMAGYELDRRNANAAAVLLAELSAVPSALLARLQALEAELASEKDELAKLRQIERDANVLLGSRARAVLALLVALGFNAGVLVLSHVVWDDQVTLVRALGIAIAFVVSVGAAAFIARGVILQNEANRRLAWALGVASIAMLVHRAVLLLLDAPVSSAFAGDMVILATSGGTVAATLDRRFTAVAGFLALAVFALALKPAWMPYTFPTAATVGAVILALGWRR
jgi:eukaryotic-like serine/threonine-protein kinase